jgi:hypothetical protein
MERRCASAATRAEVGPGEMGSGCGDRVPPVYGNAGWFMVLWNT